MITSTSSKQMKNLIALIKKSKERRSQGLFVVEGPRMFYEAPTQQVRNIYVAESFYANENNKREMDEYLDKEPALREKLEVVSDSVFKQVSDTQTPQGVMAVVEKPHYELSDLLKGDKTHLLILESVQDPGNLGTMLRTGEGAGITGVIMNKETVDLYNPKTVRSTMGSLYRMPYFITDSLENTINELKSQGVKLYAAHLKGKLSYDEPSYVGPCGFMIGNEGNGLTDETANLADTYIRIPMEGQVESLNAAISATLLMYECNRQRRRNDENLV